MDKKTRTLAAVQGLPVDRPPYAFWHHYEGDAAVGRACVAGHEKFYRESGEDFIKMMCDGYMYMPLGIDIQRASDWRHITLPKMSDPYVQEQLDRIKWMREAIDDETCIYYNVFAAFSNMRFTTSDALVMAHMAEDRAAILGALDAMADVSAQMAQLFIREGGITGCFLPVQGGERERFTVEEYLEWIAPSDLKIINAANEASDKNIVHLCGWDGVQNHLEAWRDYPGAVINWDVHTDKMSLAEGKQFFTHCNSVMGGFQNKDGSILYEGAKEEIQRFVVDLVAETGPQGMIIASDCSLHSDVPYERLRWVGEALDSLIG